MGVVTEKQRMSHAQSDFRVLSRASDESMLCDSLALVSLTIGPALPAFLEVIVPVVRYCFGGCSNNIQASADDCYSTATKNCKERFFLNINTIFKLYIHFAHNLLNPTQLSLVDAACKQAPYTYIHWLASTLPLSLMIRASDNFPLLCQGHLHHTTVRNGDTAAVLLR